MQGPCLHILVPTSWRLQFSELPLPFLGSHWLSSGAFMCFFGWRPPCCDPLTPSLPSASIGQVQVFSSIDGRPLVPYQAVVRRSQWLAVNSSFEAAWKVHKAMGREGHGEAMGLLSILRLGMKDEREIQDER